MRGSWVQVPRRPPVFPDPNGGILSKGDGIHLQHPSYRGYPAEPAAMARFLDHDNNQRKRGDRGW